MNSKYLALPLATDTEAETSLDVEISFRDISKKAENTTTKRRSLFNGSVDDIKTKPVRESEDFKIAEIRANLEIRGWRDLFTQLRSELKKAKAQQPVIDVSILPEEKRKFLADEPDMDRYLRILHGFQCNAQRFLENEFVDMLTTRQHISDLCERRIRLAKQIKLNELICDENII